MAKTGGTRPPKGGGKGGKGKGGGGADWGPQNPTNPGGPIGGPGSTPDNPWVTVPPVLTPEKRASVLKSLQKLLPVPFQFERGGTQIVLYEPSYQNGHG